MTSHGADASAKPELTPEVLEEALLYGDGCTPATAKRLYAVFMANTSAPASASSLLPEMPEMTLDDFCGLPELTHHPLRARLFDAGQKFPLA